MKNVDFFLKILILEKVNTLLLYYTRIKMLIINLLKTKNVHLKNLKKYEK